MLLSRMLKSKLVKYAFDSVPLTASDGLFFKLHLISAPEDRLPFTLEDAGRPESAFEDPERQFNNVTLETRLNNRILDLRVRFCLQYFFLHF